MVEGMVQEVVEQGEKLSGELLAYRCSTLVRMILDGEGSQNFAEPVDLQLYPGYIKLVKRPMDLGTVQKKLELLDDGFVTLEACAADVQLAFDNALLYNEDGAPVHKIAAEMKAIFEERYGEMTQAITLWRENEPKLIEIL